MLSFQWFGIFNHWLRLKVLSHKVLGSMKKWEIFHT